MTGHHAAADHEWRNHWRVVVASFFGTGISALGFFILGVFMQPVTEEFGWTRVQFSVVGTILSFVSALFIPVGGVLVGRFGAKPLILAGWALGCGALAAVGMVGPSLPEFYLLWTLVALGTALSSPVAVTTGVASWFERHRGAAVAIALNGINVVGATAPVIAAMLVSRFGWRQALFCLAGGAFAICVPIVVLWYSQKRQAGAASGSAESGSVEEDGADIVHGATVREAFASPAFWTFGIGVSLTGVALVGVVVHFIPLLGERGQPLDVAAATMSLNSLVAIICGATCGFVLDRVSLKSAGALVALFPAASALLLITGLGGLPGAALAAALLGIPSGACVPMLSVFTSRHFGMRNYSALFSLQLAIFSIIQSAGAVMAGLMRDRYGSYTLAFYCLAAIAVAGCGCMLATRLARGTGGKPVPA